MRIEVPLFALCMLYTVDSGNAVLTGYTAPDITKDPDIHCEWLGGLEPQLKCVCLTFDNEFIIYENSIPPFDVTAINITNCGRIHFGPFSIRDMRNLRRIELSSINSLSFAENSLYWVGVVRTGEYISDWDSSVPSLKITIDNSRISRIANQAFRGRIQNVTFSRVIVDEMAPFAFSSLQQNLDIVFDEVQMKKMVPQNFKKFTTERLLIKNSKFGLIPSRAFYEVTVKQQFLLSNVTISYLKPSGFIILNPKETLIEDSTIGFLNGEGFKVTTRGDVVIKNCTFNETGKAAFEGFSLNLEEVQSRKELKLERVFFHRLTKDSLIVNTTSFTPKFKAMFIYEVCDCNTIDRYFRNEEDLDEIKCMQGNEWMATSYYKEDHCSVFKSKVGIISIIALVSGCVLVLLIIGLLCYVRELYKCGSYGKEEEEDKKVSMIVPDGRTYRQTELHVIVERADLLTTDL